MREEYDFSQGVRNPYIKHSRKQITINLEESTVTYFKQLAEESGIPYQTLINLYLTDCAKKELKPKMVWSTKGA